MIRLRTLGHLDLKDSSGLELRSVLAQPRRVALLAYLAVATPRRHQRRDLLLTLFWPEQETDRARASLNRAIYFLRRELGADVIQSEGDEALGVNPERLWCDATAFDDAVKAGQLDEALELYSGDLLPGFFASNAPGFETWLESERTRLRDRASATAWSMVEREDAAGNLALAVHWARRGVELAPFQEAGVQRLLLLLDRAGDRSGAGHAYKKFAEHIAVELEVAPSPETRALIARILAREEPLAPKSAVVQREVSAVPLSAVLESTHAVLPSAAPRFARVWGRRRAALGAAVLILVVAGISYAARSRPRVNPHSVYVAPLENQTGARALDPLGRLVADEVAETLARTGVVEVAARENGAGTASGETSRVNARADANSGHAGVVVTGAFYRDAGSLSFHVRVTDVTRRRVVWAVPPIVAPVTAPEAAIDELRRRAAGAVVALADPRYASWITVATSPPTVEAFQEYARGVELQLRGKARSAVEHLHRAYELDTTFTWARMQEVTAHMNLFESAEADSIANALSLVRERLRPVQRHWLDWMLAIKKGDTPNALRAMREAARLAPDRFLYSVANDASSLNQHREVIAVLEELGPESPYTGPTMGYWYHLTGAHHALGNHRREEATARLARKYLGNRVSALSFQASALAALGQTRELRALIDTLLMLPEDDQMSPGELMVMAAEELRAHGEAAGATEVIARAVAWYRTVVRANSADHKFELGRALYVSRNWDAADSVFRSLAVANPEDAIILGFLGAIAARRGDRAAAEEVVARLEMMRPTMSRPNEVASYWQGKIAVLLGDDARAMQRMREVCGPQGRAGMHVDFDFERIWKSKVFREFVRPKG